jgi:hypothetical protein
MAEGGSTKIGTGAIHPEVEKISGLIPATVDAKSEYRNHVVQRTGNNRGQESGGRFEESARGTKP